MTANRTTALLMELFDNQEMSLYELGIQTGMDKVDILESIDQVNGLLIQHEMEEIVSVEGVFRLTQAHLAHQAEIFEWLRGQDIYLSQEERQVLIYLYTYMRKEFVSNVHYQDLLSVSRNTTLTDIKNVRELCQQYAVSFDYTRARGYHLNGAEHDKHRLALFCVSDCLKSSIGAWALDYILRAWDEQNAIANLKKSSQQLCQFYQVSALEDRMEEFLYFLQILAVRRKRVDWNMDWQDPSVASPIPEMVDHLWKSLSQDQLAVGVLTERWRSYLSHLLQGCLEGFQDQENPFFHQLTVAIVEEMERLSLIAFEDRGELIQGLERHLIPAYYRIKSHLVSVNAYTDVIKEEHKDLFQLVQKALAPLERELGFPVPDSEVSYFVIHFGGYLEATREQTFCYKALVVCPNGVSSSLIIKENLKQLFPHIDFADTHSVTDFQAIDQSKYDMVFSTIKLETKLPFYLVPTLMNPRQKRDLFHLVNEQFGNAGFVPIEIEQLMSLIGKYATIHREQTLKYELAQFLNEKSYERKGRSPMLGELITRDTYQYQKEKMTWQEAIACASQPLLADGTIEASYIDAMVAKVNEFGPFIDLGKGVAIPHARPEDGVNRIGMSMLRLEESVYLLDDPAHEIRLLICIAAVDNQTHLRALSHLTAILRDANNIERLVTSETFDDIADLLEEEK